MDTGSQSSEIYALYCEHAKLTDIQLRGDYTTHLCNAVNKVVIGSAFGAQKISNFWIIRVRTKAALETLVQTGLLINNSPVKLYRDRPTKAQSSRVEGERLLIKDFPLNEPNIKIVNFLKQHTQIGECSNVFYSRSKQTNFVNGDRYVFTNTLNFNPPLPDRIMIGEHTCRLSYAAKHIVCQRCNLKDHKTDNTDLCKAYATGQNHLELITNGALSNFERVEMTYENIPFITSEHAYQWSKCVEALRVDLAEEVTKAKSPHEAKRIASKINPIPANWHVIKDDVMKKILTAKCQQSVKFRRVLLHTGDKIIIEARPDMHWGSGLSYNLTLTSKPAFHPGNNQLGKILMSLRSDLKQQVMKVAPTSNVLQSKVTTDTSSSSAPSHNGSKDPQDSSVLAKPISSPPKRVRPRQRSSKVPLRTKSFKLSTPMLKDLLRKQAHQKKHSKFMKARKLNQDTDTTDSEADYTDIQCEFDSDMSKVNWYDIMVTGDTDNEDASPTPVSS